MTHGKHKRTGHKVSLPNAPQWYPCPGCGKRAYQSRKDARKVSRLMAQGPRAGVYECEPGTGRFHTGRLGQAVVYGLRTRDELYPENHYADAA